MKVLAILSHQISSRPVAFVLSNFSMIFCTVERVTFVVEVSLISVRRNMRSSCKVEGGCKFWSNGNEKIVKNVGYASLVNYFSTILFQHYFDLCHLVNLQNVFQSLRESCL